jgi:hypothetical protein
MLTLRVSHLESKYISSVVDFENAKLESSLRKQKEDLITCLLPRDYGESIGLMIDFVLLFTRLSSKCLLLSKLLELYIKDSLQTIEKISWIFVSIISIKILDD